MSSVESYFATNIAVDYAHYQRFCIANKFQVAAYTDFMAESLKGFDTHTVVTTVNKVNSSCGSCGGGRAR